MDNPWAGKTIEEIRAMEYKRSPGMKPVETPQQTAPSVAPSVAPSAAPSKANAKVLAYLKEYVGQMRAAGFGDDAIRQKLIKTGSVFIPDKLPANFGQTGPWATGMAEEFGRTNATPQTIEGNIPSPNEFLNYMPGGNANRLPANYSEFTGQENPPFYNTSGKFQQSKIANLRGALQNYSANYKGETVGPSQYAYEAGVVGLPQGLGQQYYQDFLSIAQQKADEAKAFEEYKTDLKTATADEKKTEAETQKESAQPQAIQQLYNDLIEAFQTGAAPTVEDVMTNAMIYGVELSFDQANAIVMSAKKNSGVK